MPEQLTVTAFTQGNNVPSARFRVRQYLPLLAQHGVSVIESPARFGSYPPKSHWRRLPWMAATIAERAEAVVSSHHSDVLLFQREAVSTLYSVERLSRRPYVLDVDDAIWLTQRGQGIDRLARRSRLILCGNSYLAEHFSSFGEVRIVPTGVDTSVWRPASEKGESVIVWCGSSGGLPYLYALEEPLRRVLDAIPAARLRVVCNERPRFSCIAGDRTQFVQWSPEAEVAAVQSSAVGIMPMPDTPWTRGKCSFKMLTYMACEISAVASPWGMNGEVIRAGGALGAASDNEWVERLVSLLEAPEASRQLGAQGRAVVESHYACKVLAPQIAAALRDARQ